MAHIDNLIVAIKDPQLREALRAEYEKVTKTRQFGLVFDRHQPEGVLLPAFTVRAGDKVQVLLEDTKDRTAVDGTGVWTTASINPDDGNAQLRDTDGNTRTEPLERLVATREFGDPIYPGLRSTGRVLCGGGIEGDAGDKPFHTIINAENYHAIEALLYPYENQIDAIYLDPPYNTGARDWKYNNDYVDDNDPYRHSKWLSFIEKRLNLAKRLLKREKSVLMVTIDEKEVHRLGLLVQQLFPSARTQMVSVAINPAAVARGSEFRRADEYYFFVMIGAAAPLAVPLGGDWVTTKGRTHRGEIRWDLLRRSAESSARSDRPGMFYPVFVDSEGGRVHSVGEAIPLAAERATVVPPEGTIAVWPIRKNGSEGRWRLGPATARVALGKGYVKVGRVKGENTPVYYLTVGEQKKITDGIYEVSGLADGGSVVTSTLESQERRVIPATQWKVASHDSTQYGSRLLQQFLPGRRFPFPKSLYAVEDSLRFFLQDIPTALVLDFFAGSGTTAHAVARLNHQDGGRRRSILVTNNEVSVEEARTLRTQGHLPGDEAWEAIGICQHITIPRVIAAISGRTGSGEPVQGDYKFIDEFPMSDGLAENVEFFDLTYEDPALVSLGRRFEAIAPLLWLKAGAQGDRTDEIDPQGWSLPSAATYGVLFNTSRWPGFVAALASREGSTHPLTHIFVVTDSLVEFQQVVGRLDGSLDITRLYSDYLRSFEINTSRGDSSSPAIRATS